MTERSLPERIETIMDTLTNSEKKVARALLFNYPVAGLQTLVDFAEQADTSHPTVLRFIKKLGYETYPGFQQALRSEVEIRYKTPWSRPMPPSQGSTSPASSFDEFKSAINHNLETFMNFIPKNDLQDAAKKILAAKGHVYVAGAHMSMAAADYLYRMIHLSSKPVIKLDPYPEWLAQTLYDVSRKDVICAIHMPRYDRALQVFCEQAVERGASLILFTDDQMSPLTEVADHVIPAQISVPAMFDSHIVTLLQIEILLYFLIEQDPKGFQKRNKTIDTHLRIFHSRESSEEN